MSEVFSRTALQAQIDKMMSDIPAHHGYAKVKITAPDGRVSFVMAARASEHWLVQGEAFFEIPTKQWGACCEVVKSW